MIIKYAWWFFIDQQLLFIVTFNIVMINNLKIVVQFFKIALCKKNFTWPGPFDIAGKSSGKFAAC